MKSSAVHIKYLIVNESDSLWGLIVNSVGYQRIEPGEAYPPRNHPTRYLFNVDKGRVLNEYQLLYITRGKGVFTSSERKRVEVKEGNMFLLFPGEWHSYKPDKETGWDEYWIGFTGVNIDERVRNGFFNRQHPVFNIGMNDELLQQYKRAIQTAQEQMAGYQQILAGIVNYLLGNVYSIDKCASFENKELYRMNKAKVLIRESFQQNITPEQVAREINMSYSWFRRLFKDYTGFSPAQYITELRIQKSKELLTNTTLANKEIAFDSGFDNADYFCTVFKRKTGLTPHQYRNMTRWGTE
ncbi:AraC-like DNA-binding protein [Parabacteroides sp. PFB2-10]|uniref:AraC family transcriptional regulator n=1 Tax=Parabacteroides sp. PFB2-10 TaxID=1742405 RepID=UPI002473C18C|nr:helix-turn-helix domain-containing protein [Parabacteroides sp. PFB2-10]MDH6313111.1 AraC-like DNA-binding protein [Parabacteroides sp. PFB2-10]MDL2244093.1 helix-turn-helix domain-containing protein [Parabacteroides sp. OttesenSCG-928-J18]